MTFLFFFLRNHRGDVALCATHTHTHSLTYSLTPARTRAHTDGLCERAESSPTAALREIQEATDRVRHAAGSLALPSLLLCAVHQPAAPTPLPSVAPALPLHLHLFLIHTRRSHTSSNPPSARTHARSPALCAHTHTQSSPLSIFPFPVAFLMTCFSVFTHQPPL